MLLALPSSQRRSPVAWQAQQADLSRRTPIRRFQEEAGLPQMRQFLDARIDRARELPEAGVAPSDRRISDRPSPNFRIEHECHRPAEQSAVTDPRSGHVPIVENRPPDPPERHS
ncbi:hypothetical protein ACQP2K_21975 [Microbispora siamensis]